MVSLYWPFIIHDRFLFSNEPVLHDRFLFSNEPVLCGVANKPKFLEDRLCQPSMKLGQLFNSGKGLDPLTWLPSQPPREGEESMSAPDLSERLHVQVAPPQGSVGKEGAVTEGRLPARYSHVESHWSHDTRHFQKTRKL